MHFFWGGAAYLLPEWVMDMNCPCKEKRSISCSLYIQIWDSFGIRSYSSSRLDSCHLTVLFCI